MKRIQTALAVTSAAASSLPPHAVCRAVFALALIFTFTNVAGAATATKATTGTDLTVAASWSGGSGPGFPTSADTATWSGTSLGAGLTLGSAGSWGGISVTAAATDIAITGAGTLTLGTSGIAMGSSTVNLSVANNITLGGSQTWNVASAKTLTASGVISGSTFGITKSGTGTLTLSGTANTFSGTLALNAGTVIFTTAPNGTSSSLGNPSSISFGANSVTTLQTAAGAGNVTLSTPSPISIAGTASYSAKNGDASGTIFETSAKITGASGKVRTATPTTSGAIVRFSNDTSDYGGSFTTAAGVVEYTSVADGGVASSLGAGSGAYALANGASALRMRYVGAANTTSTRGCDWQGTTGTLTLENTGAGSVKYLATGNLKSGSGSSTLTLDGSNTGANELAQVVNDSGGTTSLNKNGTGSWTLSGANSYTGATVVNGGTLLVNSPGSLGSSSAVTVGASATLGGNGTINGAVSVTAGGILIPGNNGVGTLTLAKNTATSLTLNGNTIKCDLSNVAGTSDLIAITGASGALVLNGANTIALSFPNGAAPAGTYTLMTYSAKTGSGTFALDQVYPNATLNVGATSVTLTVTGAGTSAPLVWVGDGAANNWDTTTTNWLNLSTPTIYSDPSAVTFDDTDSATSAVNISSAINPFSVTVNTSTKAYTIGGAAIGGSGGLTKSGSATLTLTGANTYSGGTTINAGTVAIAAANSLGNGTSLSFGNSSTATLSLAAAATGTVQVSSATTINTFNAATCNFGNLAAPTTNLDIAAKITGSGNVKAATGSSSTIGSVRFSNDANDYSGSFNTGRGAIEFTSVANSGANSALGAGTGSYAIANGASAVKLGYVGSANTSTTRSIDWQGTSGGLLLDNSGSGSVQFLATFSLKSGSGSATLTLQGSNTGANTLAQEINDSAGTTTLAKSGLGTWILTGSNTYSGPTTISAGTLRVDGSLSGSSAVAVNGGTLGGTGTIGGAVTVATGGTIAPGSSIGTLTLSSSPSLGGTLLMEINRNDGSPLADKIVFGSAATFGGTLTVTNIGAALVSGDTFHLFDGSPSGAFASLNLPGGLGHWNTANLASAGNLSFTNANPVAPSFAITVNQGESATFIFAGSKHPLADADGDAFGITAVGGSPALGTAGFTAGTVSYTSTSSAGTDSFTYTVTDALGATSVGTVTVQVLPAGNGANITGISVILPTATVSARGIPGAIYSLQYTDSLTPVNWHDIEGIATATGQGAITLTDPAAANPGPRYYRTKYVSAR